MASRVICFRATTTPDIDDEASSTLSSHICNAIEQHVTDVANNKATQTQAREQYADTNTTYWD